LDVNFWTRRFSGNFSTAKNF